jgi:hypothetical protein
MAAAVQTGPTLMFEHCLDELKGWPDESALDFDAYLSGNVGVLPVYGGSCVHVDPLGEFALGVGPADMGIFLLQGSQELDVSNYGGTQWYAIAPTGKMSGLVATGAFELETTEFFQDWPATGPAPPAGVTAGGVIPYPPGTQLTSPTEALIDAPGVQADHTAAGKLFAYRLWPGATTPGAKITRATDPVCAVVSRMNHINHHRVPVASFWPVYLPMG